jgi:ribose transport system substrate-binding protein
VNKLLTTAAVTAALLGLAGTTQSQNKKTLAFVVNGASDFWKAAEAGVKKAQTELPNYTLTFKYPEQSSAAIQTRIMDDLVAAGVAGIMVSAVDPKTMGDALNRVGGQVALFTTDSDAPNSKRVAYIGSSNTDAGKQAGQLMLKAMPNGGKCMGFVGLPGADNARERIDGVKEVIKGTKIELVDVRGDDIDQTRAKRNVEDALAANPDLKAIYNSNDDVALGAMQAVLATNRKGETLVTGMNGVPPALRAVRDGNLALTVELNAFEWGRLGVDMLARIVKGETVGKQVFITHRLVDATNVDEVLARVGKN